MTNLEKALTDCLPDRSGTRHAELRLVKDQTMHARLGPDARIVVEAYLRVDRFVFVKVTLADWRHVAALGWCALREPSWVQPVAGSHGFPWWPGPV